MCISQHRGFVENIWKLRKYCHINVTQKIWIYVKYSSLLVCTVYYSDSYLWNYGQLLGIPIDTSLHIQKPLSNCVIYIFSIILMYGYVLVKIYVKLWKI